MAESYAASNDPYAAIGEPVADPYASIGEEVQTPDPSNDDRPADAIVTQLPVKTVVPGSLEDFAADPMIMGSKALVDNKDNPLLTLPTSKEIAADPNALLKYGPLTVLAANTPYLRGAQDVLTKTASSLTTPQNLGIVAATGGLGLAAEGTGALATAAKAALATVSAFFAGGGAIETWKGADRAIKVSQDPKSTTEDVANAWLEVIPPAGMAVAGGLGVRHSFKKAGPKAVEPPVMPETAPEPPAMPEPTVEAPKAPSIVSQIESAQGQGNAAINEALIKPVEAPPPPPEAAAPAAMPAVDYAAEQTRIQTGSQGYPNDVSPETKARNELNAKLASQTETPSPEANASTEGLTVNKVYALGPEGFRAYTDNLKKQNIGMTNDAHKFGERVQGNPEEVAKIKWLSDVAKSDFQDAMQEFKAATDPAQKSALLQKLSDLGGRSQYFSDAYQAASNTGAYSTRVESEARRATEGPVKYQDPSRPDIVLVVTKSSKGGWQVTGIKTLADGTKEVEGDTPFKTRAEAIADIESYKVFKLINPKSDVIPESTVQRPNQTPHDLGQEGARLHDAGPEGQPGPAESPAEGLQRAASPTPGGAQRRKVSDQVRAQDERGAEAPVLGNTAAAPLEVGRPAPGPASPANQLRPAAPGLPVPAPAGLESLNPVQPDALPALPVPVQPAAGRDRVPAVGRGASKSQMERALKAQDPEAYAYLKEQVATREMTQVEFDEAVKTKVKSLAAKPTTQPNAVQVESPSQVDVPPQTKASEGVREAPEVTEGTTDPRKAEQEAVKADAGAEPPFLPPPHSFTGGFYDEGPIGPRNDTPQALGLPDHIYKPGFTGIPIVGKYIFGPLKVAIGTVRQNISAASKRLGGVQTEYEFSKSEQGQKFEQMSLPLSRIARQAFTKEGVRQFGQLVMNGRLVEAKAFIQKYAPDYKGFTEAMNKSIAALAESHELQKATRGEDIGYLPNYFPRKVKDFDGLMKYFERVEKGVAEKALEKARQDKGKPLNYDEEAAVLDNVVRDYQARKGKPGFLKERSIDEIDDTISRFYEPFDVAMEDHFRKVTNDYFDRMYFGKEPGAYTRGEGRFGAVMAEEIRAGRLGAKAQKIVTDNIQDRFALQKSMDDAAYKWAEHIRTGTGAAFLGQASVAIQQFGDIFNAALHAGPRATAIGYAKTLRDVVTGQSILRDITVHQGNVEAQKFSGSKGRIAQIVTRGEQAIVHLGTGITDAFNKGGALHAFAEDFSKIIREQRKAEARNPGALTTPYARLREKYAQKFPETWQKMFQDIGNRDFDKGSGMSRESKLMLYNELADFHPLNRSEMAQLYNSFGPVGKTSYVLKSFWIKQLGAMRERGYEKLKDPATRLDGIAYLAAYTAVVGMGANMTMTWIRDKMMGRKTNWSDAALGGLMQLGGLSRYNVGQVASGHIGDAVLGFISPVAGVAKEAGHDAYLGLKAATDARDAAGRKLVRDPEDFLKQSQLIRHFPLVGNIVYSRWGAGHKVIEKERQQEADGNPRKDMIQTTKEFLAPPPTRTERD